MGLQWGVFLFEGGRVRVGGSTVEWVYSGVAFSGFKKGEKAT